MISSVGCHNPIVQTQRRAFSQQEKSKIVIKRLKNQPKTKEWKNHDDSFRELGINNKTFYMTTPITNLYEKQRVVNNAIWIVVGRLFQVCLGLVISMMTARYLGVSNFGLISYAASIVLFVSPIAKLGLDSVMVQEIILYPHREGKTLGSAMIMSFLSSLCCILGIFCFVNIIDSSQRDTMIVCTLYSTMLIAQAFELIIYWYQAKLLSKYTSIISFIAYACVSGYKIFLLLSQKNIYWFALSNAIDYSIIAIILIILFKKISNQRLGFSLFCIKSLFSKSKYYIVSGMMVTIFAQTDRIMLKLMLDDQAVGFYSAAFICAGVTSFIFSAIIDSMRPTIFACENSTPTMLEYRIKQLYSLIIYMALCQSIIVTIFANVMIYTIFGSSFSEASTLLRIIVWYSTFSYLGGAKDIWILAMGKQKFLILLNFAGAIANIILNLVLIPWQGAIGAAIATLFTQFFVNILMLFIIKSLRQNFNLMVQSLNPKYTIDILSMLLLRIKKLVW